MSADLMDAEVEYLAKRVAELLSQGEPKEKIVAGIVEVWDTKTASQFVDDVARESMEIKGEPRGRKLLRERSAQRVLRGLPWIVLGIVLAGVGYAFLPGDRREIGYIVGGLIALLGAKASLRGAWGLVRYRM